MAYFNCSAKNAAVCQGRSAAAKPADCTADRPCGNTEECASCFESPDAPSTCDSPQKEDCPNDFSCGEIPACNKSGQSIFTLLILLLLFLLLIALL